MCCEARQGPGCGCCVALCSALLRAARWCRNRRGGLGRPHSWHTLTLAAVVAVAEGFAIPRPAPAYTCFVPEGPRAVQASPQPTRQPTYVHSYNLDLQHHYN